MRYENNAAKREEDFFLEKKQFPKFVFVFSQEARILRWWPPGLKERYYSTSLGRPAGVSFVEFQAASPAAKQHPHLQQVL